MKFERLFLLLPITVLLCIVLYKIKPDDNYAPIELKHFWIYKTHHKSKYDMIFYGDSRIYRGISPNASKKILKEYKILNFGYSSAGLSPAMLEEIEQRYTENNKPKVLVLGITPHSLTPRGIKNNHFKTEKNRKKEEVLESIYLSSLKRFFLPTTPQELWKHLNKKEDSLTIIYHQKCYKSGWVASWKEPADTNEALASYRNVFKNNTVNDNIIKDFLTSIEQLRKKNIHVFGFRPPTTANMIALEDSISGLDYNNFVKLFEKAGGIWIEIDYKDFMSYDGSHLEKQSAIKLSEFLAREIKNKIIL